MRTFLCVLLGLVLASAICGQSLPLKSRSDTQLHTVTLSGGDPPRPPGASSSSAVLLIPLGADDAVPLTKPEDGVDFDIDGDGHKERVAWSQAGAEVAFLFVDQDGDGVVKNGKQLIGGSTIGEAWNGFMALRLLASRPGGAVEAEHPLFPRLLLWVDRNHDGQSERPELQPIGRVFQRIGLGYFPAKRITGQDSNGNVFRFEGWLQRVGEPLGSRTGFSPDFDVVLKVLK
jgi:hypothetical protein